MAYEALYTRGRPKNLAQLIGQEHISAALTRAVIGGKLSHAYLLIGTRGTGKTSTARLLAKAMNCDRVREAQEREEKISPREIPCNKCAACKSFDASPDNVEFDAASNRSVEDVNRLLSTAYLAPLQSRVKTFIIDEVHMLSFEAVNSILKLIEEPPPNVAFFLATTELNKVPMTIRSRCQVLNFRLIPRDIIAPYLIRIANRLQVELEEDAAKKIARLAEGSMRDAMTYLDQCYATAEEKITLSDVNETLGLVSDSDLDEIISAVKEKNRPSVGKAITLAFRSGLSAVTVAESLITRLRDVEFEILDNQNFAELRTFDEMIDALRKSVIEMQNSGIPEIILEMTLMKLAAPPLTSFSAPTQNIPQNKNLSLSVPTENLDEGKKIFYDTIESFEGTNSKSLVACLNQAVVKNFDGGVLTVAFKSKTLADMYFKDHQEKFSDALAKIAGHSIKVNAVIDEKLLPAFVDRMPEPDKTNLTNAINIFDAADVSKIKEE